MRMKKTRRLVSFLPLLLLGMVMYGCATGNVLSLPDGPSRPAAKAVVKAEGVPKVAVIDFSWTETPTSEIGRDYDNVRSIVWKGNPGKAVADLIAGILAEKGIPAVRAAKEADVHDGFSTKIWGNVKEFRVNAKRIGLVLVEIEAVTALKVQGSGPGASAGWATDLTSSYRYPEPLFFLSGDVLHAVNRAANDAAEEAVRQLMEAGVIAAPAAAEGKGTESKQ